MSGSSFVVQSTTNSPPNSCPARVSRSAPGGRASIAARSLRAASATAWPPSVVAREAVVSPVSSSRSVSTRTRTVATSTPVSSATTWAKTVWTPWPISVHECQSVMLASGSTRRRARPRSTMPLPIPTFFAAQAIPAAAPRARASR